MTEALAPGATAAAAESAAAAAALRCKRPAALVAASVASEVVVQRLLELEAAVPLEGPAVPAAIPPAVRVLSS
ncbi:hypothetical protein [Mesorhizobium sp. LjRoot246]|uniref:hypothetical protein n=1 Tax=Mesorhizobium sp. LjRoot246 TaxID=3342294 RepID=UPI003ED0D819